MVTGVVLLTSMSEGTLHLPTMSISRGVKCSWWLLNRVEFSEESWAAKALGQDKVIPCSKWGSETRSTNITCNCIYWYLCLEKLQSTIVTCWYVCLEELLFMICYSPSLPAYVLYLLQRGSQHSTHWFAQNEVTHVGHERLLHLQHLLSEAHDT